MILRIRLSLVYINSSKFPQVLCFICLNRKKFLKSIPIKFLTFYAQRICKVSKYPRMQNCTERVEQFSHYKE